MQSLSFYVENVNRVYYFNFYSLLKELDLSIVRHLISSIVASVWEQFFSGDNWTLKYS